MRKTRARRVIHERRWGVAERSCDSSPVVMAGARGDRWKMLAQRRLREALAMLDDDGAELGDAFELVEEAGMAIGTLLRRQEADDG